MKLNDLNNLKDFTNRSFEKAKKPKIKSLKFLDQEFKESNKKSKESTNKKSIKVISVPKDFHEKIKKSYISNILNKKKDFLNK